MTAPGSFGIPQTRTSLFIIRTVRNFFPIPRARHQKAAESLQLHPGTKLAPLTEMDDGKMPGEDAVNGTEMTVGQLKTDVDKRFDAVDKRFDAVDKRFDAVDKRFEQLKSDLQAHTSTLFESLKDDIRKVADGFAAQTTALDKFREEIANDRTEYDQRLDNHEVRIVALERRKRRSRA